METLVSPDTNVVPANPPRSLAGFWQRLFAFVIDGLIVGIPCTALGLSFRDYFLGSPDVAQLVGLTITLAYFSLLGSPFAGGKTLGQRIFHLRVTDKDGHPLSPGRSWARYLILITPFAASSALIARFTKPTLQEALDLILTIAAFLIIYLYLFNRRTRQSLHDVVVGSFVIDEPMDAPVFALPLWRGHWIILGSILAAGTLGLLVTAKLIEKSDVLTDITATQNAILASGATDNTSVMIVNNWTNGKTRKGLVVGTSWKGDANASTAKQIAQIALRTYPKASELDFVTVTFGGGFRIGFGTFSQVWRTSHTPQEWATNAE
jgi:uncharacterized RDD family membrane protein YckC